MENTNPKFSNGGKKTWLKLVGTAVAIAAVFVVVFGNTGLFKGSLTLKDELTPKSCTDNGGTWVQNAAADITSADKGAGGNNAAVSKISGENIIVDKEATFNGTSDYINVSARESLSFGTGDFTVSMWVNPSSFDAEGALYDSLVLDGVGRRDNAFLLIQNATTGKLRFFTQTKHTEATTNNVALNTWNHVLVIRASGGAVSVYINGTLDPTTIKMDTNITDGNAVIGRYADVSNGYFRGKMKNISVYNKALTVDEALTVYRNGGQSSPTAPTAESAPVTAQPAPSSAGHCEYNDIKVTYVEEIVLAKLKPVCEKNGGKMIVKKCSLVVAGSSIAVESAEELNSKIFEAECKKASGTFADNKCSIDKIGEIRSIDDLKNAKLQVLCMDAKEFSNDWTEKQADWKDGSCVFADEAFKDYARLDTALRNMRFYKELATPGIIMASGKFVNNKFYGGNNPVDPVNVFYQLCFKPAFEYVIASENKPADYKPFYFGGGSAGGWMDGRATRPTFMKCDFPTLTNDEPVKNQASIRSYYFDWKDANGTDKFDAVTLYEDIKKQAANLLVFEKECLSFGGVIDNPPYKTACVLNNKRFTWTQYYGQTGLKAEGERLKAAASKEASIKDLQVQLEAQKAAEEQAAKQAADEQARQAELAKLQAENDKQIKELEVKLMGAVQALSEAKAGAEREKEKAVSAAETKALTETVKNLQQMLAGEKAEKEKLLLQQQAAASAAAKSAPSSASSDAADAKIQALENQLKLLESASKTAVPAAPIIITPSSGTSPSSGQSSDDEFKKLMLQMMMQLVQNQTQTQSQNQNQYQGEIEKLKLEIEKLKLEKEQALKGAATKKTTTKKKPTVKSKTTTK